MRYHRSRRGQRRGFSLIEVAIAQVVVALAITAMCELLASGAAANAGAGELTVAIQLANNVHEMALGLPLADNGTAVAGSFHDVWDLDGSKFSPAIGVDGLPITADENWTQEVTVTAVDANGIVSSAERRSSTPMARLRVSVRHNGQYVYGANWLVAGGSR